ncbi:hypothetical protein PG984_007252 [Apiospora sp. TS-2023a]
MVRRSRPNKNRARGIANTRRGIFKKANTGHKYYGYEVAAVIRANGRVSTYESRPGILLDQTTWNVHYNCGPDDFKIEALHQSTRVLLQKHTTLHLPSARRPELRARNADAIPPWRAREQPPESRPGPSENYIYPSSLIRRDSEQDKRPAAAIYGFKSPQKTSARSPVLLSSVKRQSLLALAHDIFGDVLD